MATLFSFRIRKKKRTDNGSNLVEYILRKAQQSAKLIKTKGKTIRLRFIGRHFTLAYFSSDEWGNNAFGKNNVFLRNFVAGTNPTFPVILSKSWNYFLN